MPEGWARIRDARQRAVADVDNVCLPVSADLGDMGAVFWKVIVNIILHRNE